MARSVLVLGYPYTKLHARNYKEYHSRFLAELHGKFSQMLTFQKNPNAILFAYCAKIDFNNDKHTLLGTYNPLNPFEKFMLALIGRPNRRFMLQA